MAAAERERKDDGGEVMDLGPALVAFERRTKIVSPEMCCYCFDVLIGHLNGGHSHKSTYYIPNEEL